MTLAEAEMLFEGWRDNPPARHWLQILARAWGHKPPRRAADPKAAQPMAEILAIPGVTQRRDVHEGLGTPVLDFAALKRQAGARCG